jgi:hypothetical protein
VHRCVYTVVSNVSSVPMRHVLSRYYHIHIELISLYTAYHCCIRTCTTAQDFQLVEGDVVSGGAVKSNYSTSSLAFGNTSSNSSSSTMTINNSQLGAYMTHKGKWGYDSSAMITNNSGHKISPNNSSTSTAATIASSISGSSAGGGSNSNSSGQRRSYILSMGHRIHSLSYDDQTKQVEVKRFMSRYGSNAAPGNRYNYTYRYACATS